MMGHNGKISLHLLALARKRIGEIRLELEFWRHLLHEEEGGRVSAPPQRDVEPPYSAGSRERAGSPEGWRRD